MRTRKWGTAACAIAAAVGMLLSLAGTPAQATGSTGSIVDADGIDYDPTCFVEVPSAGRVANGIASPGGTGCTGTTSYDGSVEAADIRSVSLESTSTGWLKGSITVDGAIPAPGTTNPAAIDGPSGVTTYAQYWLLFQNKDKQTGADNPSGGCTSGFGGRRIADRHGHWADGHHFYLLYEVEHLDGRWVHTLAVGEWEADNPPGTRPIDVAWNTGSGWTTLTSGFGATPMAGRWATSLTGTGPTTINMEVTGIVHVWNPNCVHNNETFLLDMASTNPGPFSGPGYTGDTIANVKAITVVDTVQGPPVEALGWPGTFSTAGIADTTAGASTAGALGLNIPGIAVTYGALNSSMTENFANGPFCRVNVMGTRVHNPLSDLNPNQPCQVDDDVVDRGLVHMEWWDTPYGFTF